MLEDISGFRRSISKRYQLSLVEIGGSSSRLSFGTGFLGRRRDRVCLADSCRLRPVVGGVVLAARPRRPERNLTASILKPNQKSAESLTKLREFGSGQKSAYATEFLVWLFSYVS